GTIMPGGETPKRSALSRKIATGISKMAKCVTVAVGARLHLGFLDLNGGLGRRFGSLGMALDAPETIVELSRDSTDSAEGPQAERAADYVGRLAKHLDLPGGHRIVIRE